MGLDEQLAECKLQKVVQRSLCPSTCDQQCHAMTETEPPTRRWRVFDKQEGERWPIFTGDFNCLNEVLAEKPSNSAWLLLQFLNSLFRSFGQVIFANNPVSGFIIMLAIGVADYQALFAGVFASTISFVFALICRQDSTAILNGGFGFNPVLHGVVSVGALPSIYSDIDIASPKFWLFLLLTALLSVYITSALNGLFKHIGKYSIPSFTLPFNVLQFILIYCLLNNAVPSTILSPHLLEASEKPEQALYEGEMRSNNSNGLLLVANSTVEDSQNGTSTSNNHLNWGETFSGTIVAIAQVYGLNNVPCAALMYLALFVYSPMMTGFAYIGSLVGTLIGISFASNPLDVYAGVWGYNGLLCAAALGGFCFVLNVQSALMAAMSIFFTTALQHFMTPLFVMVNLPVLTMPFNLTTTLFLFISADKDTALSRPSILSFPEAHRHQYKRFSEGHIQGYLRRSQVYDGKEEI